MTPPAPIATRESFGQALVQCGERHPEVVVLDADLSKSTRTELFAKRFPERFFQMGIAEQHLLGVAAGLAMSGKTAFCASFGCFVAGRFETIKMSIAYAGANVKIIGTHAGVAVGPDGYSQMALEDLALLRALPTMQVFQPADDLEAAALAEYLCQHRGPAYIRLTRHNVTRVHEPGYRFTPSVLDVLRSGDDVALLCSGATVETSLKAAELLTTDGLSVAVINVPTIKPIDRAGLLHWGKRVRQLVTVEDHTIHGGMGSAVAEVIASGPAAPLHIHGIRDVFGESATQAELYRKHQLDGEGIATVVRAQLQR